MPDGKVAHKQGALQGPTGACMRSAGHNTRCAAERVELECQSARIGAALSAGRDSPDEPHGTITHPRGRMCDEALAV